MSDKNSNPNHWSNGGDMSYGGTSILKKLSERFQYTEDLHAFAGIERIPVFVYGDNKKSGVDAKLLESSEFYGTAETNKGFIMRVDDLLVKPVVFKDDSGGSFKIKGECYGLSVQSLVLLDDYMRNGVETQRVKTHIECRQQYDHGKSSKYVFAWMYVGREQYWENRRNFKRHKVSMITTGNKTIHYQEWLPGIDDILSDDGFKPINRFGRGYGHDQNYMH